MADAEELRRLSAAVFGNRYRAELLQALARAGDRGVCLGELARERGVGASVYHAPVRALVAQGLAEQVPVQAGERRRWYRGCAGGQMWQLLATVVECLERDGSPVRVA
jgi:DNA-binding MarR family transcriptional regulator